MTDVPAKAPNHDYKDTLFLPETEFPMRGGLPQREPEWLAHWAKMDLYKRLRELSKDRRPWVLHDGPPYANGHLHIGHALNKTLKDFVTRSHQILGYDSRYVPGWDCHGLPIEWKIEEKYREKKLDKSAVPINEFRRECREFAAGWIDVQREEFKRLGVIGDWDNPYTTMKFSSEATIAREFLKFVMNGLLYRGSKPVMWSPVEKTALADAEVEYHDRVSPTIHVRFPVVRAPTGALSGAEVVIWTTTPWTIPSNRGVAYGEDVHYGLYEVTEAPEDNWVKVGAKLALADNLAEEALTAARVGEWRRLYDLTPKDFEGAILGHPFRGQVWADRFWDYEVPMLPGGFVTEDAGTGFVHTAPSHGVDDFELFAERKLLDRITYNILEDSAFAEHVPHFAGLRVLEPNGKDGKANDAVMAKLAESGRLMARGKLKHSYPHSWRSKAPVIYRNTPQWFVAMDQAIHDSTPQAGLTLRQRALKTIAEDVEWTPKSAYNRMRSMIETRPDWVLSRQRAWGVPLCCFMREKVEEGAVKVELLRDEAVNARILAAFEEEGADAWFAEGAAARFLAGRPDAEQWTQVTDILDVWFDSGSTHAFVMEDRKDGIWPASLYLEGTDQHRGWFQSSLLEASATRGRAPYEGVLTHGFTLDEKGQKMSKSLGNTVAPQEVIKDYGADILRLWIAQTDFTEDQRIGPTILKGVADSYRRLRNTLRYMLGALDGFDEAERVEAKDMPELERWVLHRLAELDQVVREGYQAYEFQKVFAQIFNFCTTDLSAVYFDIRKDALYCDSPSSLRRRSARTVMDLLFHRLTTWLSPILCFTAEDVWLSRFPGEDQSVHLQVIPETPKSWLDPELAARWEAIRAARRVVTGALEIARRDKVIGASLEAAPVAYVVDPALLAALRAVDFAEICISSDLTLEPGEGPAEAFRLQEVPGVAVVFAKAEGEKCARCWRVTPEVGAQPKHEDLCARCAEALG